MYQLLNDFTNYSEGSCCNCPNKSKGHIPN